MCLPTRQGMPQYTCSLHKMLPIHVDSLFSFPLLRVIDASVTLLALADISVSKQIPLLVELLSGSRFTPFQLLVSCTVNVSETHKSLEVAQISNVTGNLRILPPE